MENFREEAQYFIEQTAKMNIFATAGTEAYACYREFIIKALTLLESELEEPFSKWLNTFQITSGRATTSAQLAETRKAIEEYRCQQLGLNNFGVLRTGANDALTVLFMFAFEDWPSNPETLAKTSIIQAIDEFSSTYIEFFGNGIELVRILKNCFHVQ